MRTTKKIIMAIFAMLPIITLIFNMIFYFKSAETNNYPFVEDKIYVRNVSDSPRIAVEVQKNSFAERCFFDIFGYNNYTGEEIPIGESKTFSTWKISSGFTNAILRFIIILNNAGMPLTTSSVIVCFYISYLITIELLMTLYEIAIFIPRKCKEIIER